MRALSEKGKISGLVRDIEESVSMSSRRICETGLVEKQEMRNEMKTHSHRRKDSVLLIHIRSVFCFCPLDAFDAGVGG